MKEKGYTSPGEAVFSIPCTHSRAALFVVSFFSGLALLAVPRARAVPEGGSGKAEDLGTATPSHSLHLPGRPNAKRGNYA